MTSAEFLLALVADRPAGAKVDIAALRRAFTPTQAQMIEGIETLIKRGLLDPETLRRPRNNETPVPGHDPGPSEPPAPRVEAKGGGAARYDVAPSPIDLERLLQCFTDEFEALIIVARRYGVETSRIVRHTRTLRDRGLLEFDPPKNGRPSILWRRARPTPLSIPDEELAQLPDKLATQLSPAARDQVARAKRAHAPRAKAAAKPRISRPAACPAANEDKEFQRKAQAALRTNRTAAEAFLDSGKTSGDAKNVSLRIEARKVEIRRAEEARQACPIEQAKTILRRRYSPVIAAETSGGPKGKFYVGKLIVDEAGLMRMAKAMAA